MKRLVGMTAIALTALAPAALADDAGVYVGASGALSVVSDYEFSNGNANDTTKSAEFSTGGGALLRGGYDFGSIRTELEIGWRAHDIESIGGQAGIVNDGGSLNFYTAMVKGAYDFDTGTAVTPYLSLGVGAAFAEGDIGYTAADGERYTKNYFGVAPAGEIGVGASYALTDDMDLIGGYSFLGAPTDEANEDQVIQAHSLQLGLNYGF
ncbi:MAG: outer membrane beta-barrel protein [Marivibrio sp.]|uniref:outer membrane protein n=1 Tax=Marivibrio sp. TaxID=2039719 RepID=UPI0032EAC7EC